MDYILGPDDILEVTVAGLYDGSETQPMRAQVMASGTVLLPLVGAVHVGGTNLLQAQKAITASYADGILVSPRVSLVLAEKSTVNVLVLGEANTPGAHALAKFENDVGHALAAAGGMTQDAAHFIEIHRRTQHPDLMRRLPVLDGSNFGQQVPNDPKRVIKIPLRGATPGMWSPEDIVLQRGDVVKIPSRRHEVFYVVGQLNQNNSVRFTVGDRERELGVGLVLPRDREIDVVTAVAMAGYIDPIDSPTTVTVHRVVPGDCPLLIHVDLIKARYDYEETVLVQPGDIIYLNPDAHWWMRRTFDRIVPDLLTIPYSRGIVW